MSEDSPGGTRAAASRAPVVVLPDGAVLVEPSDDEARAALAQG